MKIKIRQYRVKLFEVTKEEAGVSIVVRECHEMEDMGYAPNDGGQEVNENSDMHLLVKQMGQDNQAHEKMMCRIRNPGDIFILKVKMLVND